jgi:hypothetical protein
MEIDISNIRNGSMNGEIVFICDYRRPDLDKKAIRNVPPTKVMIRSNSETKKRIYYSESHFVTLKKDGSPSSKVIPLFDNTGFRSYTGEPLKVFDNEAECIAQWNDDLKVVEQKWAQRKAVVYKQIDEELNNISGMFL